MGEWSAEHRARPLLVNAERKGHWSVRSRETAEWRKAFGWLWRAERIPPLATCSIRVEHFTRTRTKVDVAACLPAAKAAIDAIVDAGILPNDGPDHVLEVCFRPPEYAGYDSVRLTITGIEAESAHGSNHPTTSA